MTISDDDFFLFYQNFLALVVAEEDCAIDMHFAASFFCSKDDDDVWYEKAVAALTRLGISGLICHDKFEHDIRPLLKYMFLNREDNIWLACYFNPTEAGVRLAKKLLIYFNEENRPRIITDLCEEFREELGRIFEEYGVGFDVELPYGELLSIKND